MSRSRGQSRGLDICCSIVYVTQTRDQQRFTISEVAADWHELMVLHLIIWPSIAHADRQLALLHTYIHTYMKKIYIAPKISSH